jgi:hypothetical protein
MFRIFRFLRYTLRSLFLPPVATRVCVTNRSFVLGSRHIIGCSYFYVDLLLASGGRRRRRRSRAVSVRFCYVTVRVVLTCPVHERHHFDVEPMYQPPITLAVTGLRESAERSGFNYYYDDLLPILFSIYPFYGNRRVSVPYLWVGFSLAFSKFCTFLAKSSYAW